ncbi:MAG: hypothetical protein ONB32_04395, partial [candidate division KSB1 bacterium]|nr:hypothetical protein [candidate division KSB1 bacterium]
MNQSPKCTCTIVVMMFFVVAVTAFASDSSTITITNFPGNHFFRPLDWVEFTTERSGITIVRDGNGVVYFQQPIKRSARFRVAGALGSHTITLLDNREKLLDIKTFKVDCQTQLIDQGGEFSRLLDMLYYTMVSGGEIETYRYNGKSHVTFAGWFQDHVHVMKAMKYFYPDVTSGIDLFAESQREDGMIYDNYYSPYPT